MPRVPFVRHHDRQQDRHSGDVLAVPRVRRSVERRTARGQSALAIRLIPEVIRMTDRKQPARPVLHECPVCHFPQTKIQRRLSGEKHGSTNYVCTRTADCVVGIDLAKVDTWIAV